MLLLQLYFLKRYTPIPISRKMEEELLARETTQIWENIEDMMEEEFEEFAIASAAAAAVGQDPGPKLEEARVRFQLKFNEKKRKLEKAKTLLEESTTTLEKIKRFTYSYKDESEEWEIRFLEEEIMKLEKQKRGKKKADVDGKVSENTEKVSKDVKDPNKPELQQ